MSVPDTATAKKRIVVVGRMPDRATSAERIAHMREDVADMVAQLRHKVTEKAQSMHVTGWTLDEDSEEFVTNGRTIILNMVVWR